MTPKPEHVEKANQMVGQAEVAILESRNNMGVNTLVAMNNALVKLRSDIALALSDAEKVHKWNDIESAPKNRDIIGRFKRNGRVVCDIIHYAHGGGEEQPRFGPGWFYWIGCNFEEVEPTHWTELPSEPDSSLPAARKDQA